MRFGSKAAVGGLVILLTAAAALAACPGDCGGDNEISASELIAGVGLALASPAAAPCSSSFDTDTNGSITIDELVSAVIAAKNGCPPPAPTPIFPANYRDTYSEVRNCRFSTEHGGVYIRVLANAVGAQPYLNSQNPLPVGSVVVKEEYDAEDCSNASKLVRWRAMLKESPGFDPVDGDWHWQWVNADRSVLFNDKSTCIACHSVPACLGRDRMCTAPNRVSLVLSGLPAALLSISGTSSTDLIAVGADPIADDFGPYVLRYNGSKWTRLNTGTTGDLWWISVAPIDGVFYMSGAGGLILRYDPQSNEFLRAVTPGSETMFGVWGIHEQSLWAVGGDLTNPSNSGVIWHFDGTTWTVQDLSGAFPAGLPPLFKVWGRSESEIYAVGQNGVILRYDGSQWSLVSSPALDGALFTVHGNDQQVVAVGGFFDNGAIFELDGDHFVDRTPSALEQTNGVFIPPNGMGVAVGREGEVSRRDSSGWTPQDPPVSTRWDFHATWVDPQSGVWAVGGDLLGDNTQGIVGYAGPQSIGATIDDLVACPPGTAGGPTSVSFATDVVPILTANSCKAATCHVGPFPASSLSLTSYAGLFGKSFGPGVLAKQLHVCAVVPGHPETSFLIEKLGANPRSGMQMPQPPRPPLSDSDVNVIRTWILEGAQDN